MRPVYYNPRYVWNICFAKKAAFKADNPQPEGYIKLQRERIKFMGKTDVYHLESQMSARLRIAAAYEHANRKVEAQHEKNLAIVAGCTALDTCVKNWRWNGQPNYGEGETIGSILRIMQVARNLPLERSTTTEIIDKLHLVISKLIEFRDYEFETGYGQKEILFLLEFGGLLGRIGEQTGDYRAYAMGLAILRFAGHEEKRISLINSEIRKLAIAFAEAYNSSKTDKKHEMHSFCKEIISATGLEGIEIMPYEQPAKITSLCGFEIPA